VRRIKENNDRMYAIVNIAGQQYKVEKDQKLFVHRLEDKEGETVRFEEVLLIDNDKNVLVGEPTIKGAMITGKVLSHAKGDKVQVFKKKRRKGYKVLRGHRQYLTEIQIQEILEKGAVKEAKPKAATSPKEPAGKAPAKKPAAKSEGATARKAAAKPAAKTAAKIAEKPAAKPAAKTAAKIAEKPAAKPAAKTAAKIAEKPAAKPAAKGAAKKGTGTKAKAAPKKSTSQNTDKEE
jgi:large subunit ribosomal protein L21